MVILRQGARRRAKPGCGEMTETAHPHPRGGAALRVPSEGEGGQSKGFATQ